MLFLGSGWYLIYVSMLERYLNYLVLTDSIGKGSRAATAAATAAETSATSADANAAALVAEACSAAAAAATAATTTAGTAAAKRWEPASEWQCQWACKRWPPYEAEPCNCKCLGNKNVWGKTKGSPPEGCLGWGSYEGINFCDGFKNGFIHIISSLQLFIKHLCAAKIRRSCWTASGSKSCFNPEGSCSRRPSWVFFLIILFFQSMVQ